MSRLSIVLIFQLSVTLLGFWLFCFVIINWHETQVVVAVVGMTAIILAAISSGAYLLLHKEK